MDCGPAALTAVFSGFGMRVSYARLRDACQTDVDGTSIDAMEDIAGILGLDAEQVMLPVEHLVFAEAQALPAIVVTRLPDGFTHFVVVWRRHGPLLQIMDPSVGRRWVSAARFLDEVYRHDFAIPAAAFGAWARSNAFRAPLRGRLRRLGVSPSVAYRLLSQAAQMAGWEALGRLDAATRMVEAQVRQKLVARGRGAARRVADLAEGASAAIDAQHWFAQAHADHSRAEVTIRGAVLVHVSGPAADPVPVEDLSTDLRAALLERPRTPGRFLLDRLRALGTTVLAAAGVGALLSAAGLLAESALLRTLLGTGPTNGAATAWTLVWLGAGLLAVDCGLSVLAAGVGRRLEIDVRARLLRHLPLLPDKYVRSRPLSDLAQRAHRLHKLRELPALGVEAIRGAVLALLLPAAITILDPPSAPLALGTTIVCTAAAVLLLPAQAERDLRVRSHAGAIARFYLDALLGQAAIRAHRAQRVLASEHTRMLGSWGRAVHAVHRSAVTAELIQATLGLSLTAWLLVGAAERITNPGSLLLLTYWAVGLPVACQQLGGLLRRYPGYRSIILRGIEPLATPAERATPATADGTPPATGTAVEVSLQDVTVVAGGHQVLSGIDLTITAGSHVAIVGRAGSGKSTLIELLLGWHRPAAGTVLVDGIPLDGERLARLRAETAWVDPTVTLWNAPLTANLTYGAGPVADPNAVLDIADLRPVVAALGRAGGNGLAEPLGEEGRLLSGGETQRVRLGRALLREGVRLALLDEPFRGLDHGQRTALLARVRQRWADQTMLFVTHDVTDTLDFSRVLVVEAGRVVEDGHPQELLREDSHYAHLLAAENKVAAMFDEPGWRRVTVAAGTIVNGGPSR
jgi:ATP-binding cassette subfamily B protein